MSKTTCPQCGEPASGNFCAACGAALSERHCTQCGTQLTPGSRFCTQCGAEVGATKAAAPASASGGRQGGQRSAPAASTTRRKGGGGAQGTGEPSGDANLGWWAAGGLLIVIIIVFAWPLLRPDQVGPEPMGAGPGQAAPASGPAAVDLSSMTPRQAADRLFDRVMTAAESGDSASALQFLPMAIQAYERAQPLDLDGAFHLSTLQRTGMNLQAALTTAQAALEQDGNHLLLLHAAGEAARELGEAELAAGFYQRILDVYEGEANLQKPAYLAHENMLPSVRQNAAQQVGG